MTKDIFIGTNAENVGAPVPDETGSPPDDDADGLSNEVEQFFGGDPRQADTDQDGYSDGLEYVGRDGDPLNASAVPTSFNRVRILKLEDAIQNDPDSDQDGLGDTFELNNGLDPNDPDTDDDGYSDALELLANSNPFDPQDRPERDAPPAPDGIDRLPPGPRDADNDGLSDDVEMVLGTSTTRRDTDGDGFSDAVEVLAGSDPLDFLSVPNLNVPPPPEN